MLSRTSMGRRKKVAAGWAATIAVLLVFAAPAAVLAASCRDGETTVRNGIQYTCFCTTSGGQTSCVWRAD